MNDLFDLTFESVTDSDTSLLDLSFMEAGTDSTDGMDLLDLSFTEEGDEFEGGSPADPTDHFNSDNSKERSISIPGDVKLDEDTYNKALDQLQKSFKEGVEILGALKEARGVADDIMNDYID